MLTIPLNNIMSTDLITLQADHTVDRVDEIFRTNGFHHIPVVDHQGQICGLVSKSDYLTLSNKFTLFRESKEREKNLRFFQSLLVSDIMTKHIVTLSPTDTLSKAADIFRENLFHAIPITDDHKTLLGIVTTFDLINYTCSNRASLNEIK